MEEEILNPKTKDIQEFLEEIGRIRKSEELKKDEPKIKAALTLGRLAFFYEKIRNTLEYKDEHLIIKSALERILKRKFFSYHPGEPLAKSIIFELIGGGYISNNSIPESKVLEISAILDRYYYLFSSSARKFSKKDISSILACALEESLRNEAKEKEALVKFTQKSIKENLVLDIPLDTDTINIQLYIAIHRVLLKSDYQTIKYHLLKKLIPNLENPDINVHEIVIKFEDASKEIDQYIKSKLRVNFLKFLRRNIPPYSVLGKMLAENSTEKIKDSLNDENSFNNLIEKAYSSWRDKAYQKISRSAIRSILFIFFTKMVLAFILELPYDIFVLREINWIPLGINLIFPPAYMFLSTFNVYVPGRENLDIIKKTLRKIVYKEEEISFELRCKKRSTFKGFIFSLIYILTFVISFGAIIFVLNWLKFNIVSGVLFFVFFSTISFFAYRITQIAKELSMVKKTGGGFGIISDFFSTPFIKLGHILSSNFQKINIFLFILDVIIEMPFKTFMEFLEDWANYAKEKKENILNE